MPVNIDSLAKVVGKFTLKFTIAVEPVWETPSTGPQQDGARELAASMIHESAAELQAFMQAYANDTMGGAANAIREAMKSKVVGHD